MPFLRNAFVVAFVACAASSCGDRPMPANPVLQNLANQLQGKTVCFIHHPSFPQPTIYTGPDGRAVPLSGPQCEQANEDAQAADVQAQQQRAADAERAAQEAYAQEQKRAAAAAQVLRDEDARGYKPVAFKDLILDARAYAAENAVKVSVPGFYKMQGRRDERLYASYNDFMMHAYQSVEAAYIGLITDGGSRTLREYLMRCGAMIGCPITVLGHVSPCTETNAFGAAIGDFCLVAEDMRAP